LRLDFDKVVLPNPSAGSITFNLNSGTFDFRPKDSTSPSILQAVSEICLGDGKKIRSSDPCRRIYLKDRRGRLTIYHKTPENLPDFKIIFTSYQPLPIITLQLEIENNTAKSFSVKRLRILEGGIRLSDLCRWCFFKNGWYSWDRSYSIRFGERDKEPKVAGDFLSGFVESSRFVSAWMGMVVQPESKAGMLMGFVSMKEQMGTITAEVRDFAEGQLVVTAESFTEDLPLVPGGRLKSERLMLLPFYNGFKGLEQYADFVAREMKARTPQRVPTGWCSWYYYFSEVTEDDVLKNLEFLAENRDRYPVEYVQLDDGYQTAIGDWLSVNEKFPHGIKWLCEQIRRKGFKPGLWLAPFCVGANSKLYRQHPDWVVRDAEGNPIVAFRHWNTEIYGLDCTHPAAQSFLKRVFDTIIHDWGIEYVKIDFLFAGALRGRRADPNATSIQAYRRGLEIIREAVGERFILGCGAPLGPTIGLVDAMRISEDVGPVWEDDCSVSTAIKATFSRYFIHRKWWINDPDCLIVRQDHTQLNLDEVRSLATVIALSGGTLFSSDDLTSLTEERRRLLQVLLPVDTRSAVPIDLFERKAPQVFVSTLENGVLVGVLNWEDEFIDLQLPLGEIGMGGGKAVHVFEFWEERYLGRFQDSIWLHNIPPHGVKLLAVQPAGNNPSVLLCNFHLRQGGVNSVRYHPGKGRLSFMVRLRKGVKGKVFVYVPRWWEVQKINCENLQGHSFNEETGILTLEVKGDGESPCEIYFRRPLS